MKPTVQLDPSTLQQPHRVAVHPAEQVVRCKHCGAREGERIHLLLDSEDGASCAGCLFYWRNVAQGQFGP